MTGDFLPLPNGDRINTAQIAWVENLSWRQTAENGQPQFLTGIAVHFSGGSQLRLTGADANTVRDYLGMPA